MPNDVSAILPKILARGLMTLRQRVMMPRLVNADYSRLAAQKGSVIDVPVPAAKTATAVTPGATPPTPSNTTPTRIQVPLDQWYHSDCQLSDNDLAQIDKDQSFLPMEVQECFKALANNVNQYLWGLYKGVYGIVGTAGTTPFASDASAATNARKILNKQLCPLDMRSAVLDYDAEANALALAPFRDASQSADNAVVAEGQIGRKYGMQWYGDDHVPTHTSTALTAGAATINGVNAAGGGSTDNLRTGTVSIAKATNSAPLVAGDILEWTVGGVVQQHVVVTGVTLAVGNTTVTVAPALRVATAGGETVTLRATHVVNMAFRYDAFAFATRSLIEPSLDVGAPGYKMETMTDPVSRLTVRVEVMRQYKQWCWDFDILYGGLLVQPANAVRIAG